MRWRASSIGAAVVFVCMATASCESDDDWSYDGPRSGCSTGTPSSNQTFPSLTETARQLPECIPRCGVTKETFGYYGTVWTIDALPRGACQYGGETCSMTAVRTLACDDGTKSSCSLTGYWCRCEESAWRCYQGAVGASACTCPPRDAGAD